MSSTQRPLYYFSIRFRASLERRCVVVVDGFFEWKRDGEQKQPYFVYARQEDGVKITDLK